mgnify:FL=1
MTQTAIHRSVIEGAVSILVKEPSLRGVCIVSQNEQELATLIQTEEGMLDGLVVVVTVDDVQKIHSNPAKYRVTFGCDCTEIVPHNREKPGFMTALDAGMACGEALDAAKFGHFDRLRHTTPGNGVLHAVAECSGEFTLE